VWTAVHDLAADQVLMPGRDGAGYPAPLADLTGTIFVISRYDRAARDTVAADSYFARTVVSGDTVLDVFGRPVQPLEALAARRPGRRSPSTRCAACRRWRPGRCSPSSWK
jgi:hypothetical protein